MKIRRAIQLKGGSGWVFEADLVEAILALVVILCIALPAQGSAFASEVPGAAQTYRSTIVRETEVQFGLPAPSPVIAAQIMQESQFKPGAHSSVGAEGLMQFMPATAEWAAVAGQLGQAQPTSPTWAIRAGVWYDRWLYERVRGDTECDRWDFTLSAYNGGLGNVYKRQKLSAQPYSWQATGHLNPGITAANQAQNDDYSTRILIHWQSLFTDWGRTVCLN